MKLGERIKAARQAAGLSQRQLCGQVITRNMLSLIESGKARPSMDTLQHFARVLGKPVGYFLEEQTVLSPNQVCMEQAQLALENRDFAATLAALEQYVSPDGLFDRAKVQAECAACMGLAQQALDDGKRAYCIALLDRADAVGGADRQRILLRYAAQPEKAAELAKALPSIAEELLLLADGALAAGAPDRAAAILDAADKRDARWMLLRGKAWMQLEQYGPAAECLTQAEATFAEACVPLLEQCYKEMGDYKQAYAYACKQRTN